MEALGRNILKVTFSAADTATGAEAANMDAAPKSSPAMRDSQSKEQENPEHAVASPDTSPIVAAPLLGSPDGRPLERAATDVRPPVRSDGDGTRKAPVTIASGTGSDMADHKRMTSAPAEARRMLVADGRKQSRARAKSHVVYVHREAGNTAQSSRSATTATTTTTNAGTSARHVDIATAAASAAVAAVAAAAPLLKGHHPVPLPPATITSLPSSSPHPHPQMPLILDRLQSLETTTVEAQQQMQCVQRLLEQQVRRASSSSRNPSSRTGAASNRRGEDGGFRVHASSRQHRHGSTDSESSPRGDDNRPPPPLAYGTPTGMGHSTRAPPGSETPRDTPPIPSLPSRQFARQKYGSSQQQQQQRHQQRAAIQPTPGAELESHEAYVSRLEAELRRMRGLPPYTRVPSTTSPPPAARQDHHHTGRASPSAHPEHRYHTTKGLSSRLELCLQELQQLRRNVTDLRDAAPDTPAQHPHHLHRHHSHGNQRSNDDAAADDPVQPVGSSAPAPVRTDVFAQQLPVTTTAASLPQATSGVGSRTQPPQHFAQRGEGANAGLAPVVPRPPAALPALNRITEEFIRQMRHFGEGPAVRGTPPAEKRPDRILRDIQDQRANLERASLSCLKERRDSFQPSPELLRFYRRIDQLAQESSPEQSSLAVERDIDECIALAGKDVQTKLRRQRENQPDGVAKGLARSRPAGPGGPGKPDATEKRCPSPVRPAPGKPTARRGVPAKVASRAHASSRGEATTAASRKHTAPLSAASKPSSTRPTPRAQTTNTRHPSAGRHAGQRPSSTASRQPRKPALGVPATAAKSPPPQHTAAASRTARRARVPGVDAPTTPLVAHAAQPPPSLHFTVPATASFQGIVPLREPQQHSRVADEPSWSVTSAANARWMPPPRAADVAPATAGVSSARLSGVSDRVTAVSAALPTVAQPSAGVARPAGDSSLAPSVTGDARSDGKRYTGGRAAQASPPLARSPSTTTTARHASSDADDAGCDDDDDVAVTSDATTSSYGSDLAPGRPVGNTGAAAVAGDAGDSMDDTLSDASAASSDTPSATLSEGETTDQQSPPSPSEQRGKMPSDHRDHAAHHEPTAAAAAAAATGVPLDGALCPSQAIAIGGHGSEAGESTEDSFAAVPRRCWSPTSGWVNSSRVGGAPAHVPDRWQAANRARQRQRQSDASRERHSASIRHLFNSVDQRQQSSRDHRKRNTQPPPPSWSTPGLHRHDHGQSLLSATLLSDAPLVVDGMAIAADAVRRVVKEMVRERDAERRQRLLHTALLTRQPPAEDDIINDDDDITNDDDDTMATSSSPSADADADYADDFEEYNASNLSDGSPTVNVCSSNDVDSPTLNCSSDDIDVTPSDNINGSPNDDALHDANDVIHNASNPDAEDRDQFPDSDSAGNAPSSKARETSVPTSQSPGALAAGQGGSLHGLLEQSPQPVVVNEYADVHTPSLSETVAENNDVVSSDVDSEVTADKLILLRAVITKKQRQRLVALRKAEMAGKEESFADVHTPKSTPSRLNMATPPSTRSPQQRHATPRPNTTTTSTPTTVASSDSSMSSLLSDLTVSSFKETPSTVSANESWYSAGEVVPMRPGDNVPHRSRDVQTRPAPIEVSPYLQLLPAGRGRTRSGGGHLVAMATSSPSSECESSAVEHHPSPGQRLQQQPRRQRHGDGGGDSTDDTSVTESTMSSGIATRIAAGADGLVLSDSLVAKLAARGLVPRARIATVAAGDMRERACGSDSTTHSYSIGEVRVLGAKAGSALSPDDRHHVQGGDQRTAALGSQPVERDDATANAVMSGVASSTPPTSLPASLVPLPADAVGSAGGDDDVITAIPTAKGIIPRGSAVLPSSRQQAMPPATVAAKPTTAALQSHGVVAFPSPGEVLAISHASESSSDYGSNAAVRGPSSLASESSTASQLSGVFPMTSVPAATAAPAHQGSEQWERVPRQQHPSPGELRAQFVSVDSLPAPSSRPMPLGDRRYLATSAEAGTTAHRRTGPERAEEARQRDVSDCDQAPIRATARPAVVSAAGAAMADDTMEDIPDISCEEAASSQASAAE